MHLSKVSVICISHNHESFLEEAIQSVVNQTYDNIEIIIVDDCSNDNSQTVISNLKQKYSHIQTIILTENVGNCIAFNI